MFVITVSLDFLEIKEMESQYYQLIFQLKYTCNVSQQFFLEWSFSFLFLVLSSVINSPKTSLNIPLSTKLDMWHLYEKGGGEWKCKFHNHLPHPKEPFAYDIDAILHSWPQNWQTV